MLASISTRSLNMVLQKSLLVMQRDLSSKQVEMQTGKIANIALGLGEGSGTVVSIERNISTIESIRGTNAIAVSRLNATQNSLTSLRVSLSDLVSTLAASDYSETGRIIAIQSARASLQEIGSAVNTTHAGQYIFGGENTEANPLKMGTGIPAGPEMESAFTAYFGFPKDSASAANITAAAFISFIENEIKPIFNGPTWNFAISNATDTVMQSRIGLNDIASTSVSANDASIRKSVFSASLAATFLDSSLNTEVTAAILAQSIVSASNADVETAAIQARSGIVQERLEKAEVRLTSQRDLLLSLSDGMTSVDPYETSVKLNSLLTQIELSYALTQKIQNLSILHYLS